MNLAKIYSLINSAPVAVVEKPDNKVDVTENTINDEQVDGKEAIERENNLLTGNSSSRGEH